MKPFEYLAPNSLREAVEILIRHGGAAQAIAGGTDLLRKMKLGQAAPSVVVSLRRIPELRGLRLNGRLTLGALTSAEEIRASPLIREHAPALAAAAGTMASVQIRNLATVGGNLCTAAPSADLAPILIALQAEARLVGPQGERCVPLDQFFTGPGQTVLKPGELLASLAVPLPAPRSLYRKHSPRPHMDIAVVGVALALEGYDPRTRRCRQARVVLGAVAPTPRRARSAERELADGPLTPERIERAAGWAADEAQPIDDVRASAWYRRRMVAVLTRQGLGALSAG